MSSQSIILTRTFSLIPRAPGKASVYRQMMDGMRAFCELENAYLNILVEALQSGRLSTLDFSGDSKVHLKSKIYNELQLNEVYLTHPAKLPLKERMLRCALQYPYFAVREWLVRSHYLSLLLQELTQLIAHSPRHAVGFLQGTQLSHAAMKRLSRVLDKNVFGTRASLSYYYIQNLLGQVRNLFLAASSLESKLSVRIKEILDDSALIEQFVKAVLSSFTRKRKGTGEVIPASDLLPYFLKRYTAQVKRKSSWHAKHIDKHPDLKEFKKVRDQSFAPLEVLLREYMGGLGNDFISRLTRDVLHELLERWSKTTTHALTKQVFKPVRRAPKASLTLSREDFAHYFKHVLGNQLRRTLSELFLTTPIVESIIMELKHLKTSMSQLVPPPRIKRLAVPINQEESVYRPDLGKLTVKLSFISRQWLSLDIKDDKGRIKRLLDGGATPCLPVISMKGRKLLLHLPFELNSSDLSHHASERMIPQEKCIEIGVDLGLKHPAVLSVMDRSEPHKPVEITRYFLSMRTLLDMQFNLVSGTFETKKRFSNVRCDKTSNMKRSLRNLRREARNLQRKVHEYEHRYIEKTGNTPHNRYKYYRLQRDVTRTWERVNHINREVVRQLQHLIIRIATFHGASVLKFENLKWSRHSRKQETGGWLSFWQTHWFFSQVQEAVEFQASMRGIAFRRVRASYTSQDCWECRARGSREGRSFTCTNAEQHASGKPFQIHADLNAARIIARS